MVSMVAQPIAKAAIVILPPAAPSAIPRENPIIILVKEDMLQKKRT